MRHRGIWHSLPNTTAAVVRVVALGALLAFRRLLVLLLVLFLLVLFLLVLLVFLALLILPSGARLALSVQRRTMIRVELCLEPGRSRISFHTRRNPPQRSVIPHCPSATPTGACVRDTLQWAPPADPVHVPVPRAPRRWQPVAGSALDLLDVLGGQGGLSIYALRVRVRRPGPRTLPSSRTWRQTSSATFATLPCARRRGKRLCSAHA